MNNSLHDGHRERLRKEFLKSGFSEETPPHKVLEMLLFYSIPRKDTNEIAHNLLNKFGSMSSIFEATPEELMSVNGVSENTAALLKLFMPIAKLYISDKTKTSEKFKNIDDICKYLLTKYFGLTKEVFSLTTFSSSGRKLGFDILNSGTVNSVNVSMREIIQLVLKRNATCAIIAHNHPDGLAIPSKEDVEMTKTIRTGLEHIGVRLIDHIILADDDYVSMFESNNYSYLFK